MWKALTTFVRAPPPIGLLAIILLCPVLSSCMAAKSQPLDPSLSPAVVVSFPAKLAARTKGGWSIGAPPAWRLRPTLP